MPRAYGADPLGAVSSDPPARRVGASYAGDPRFVAARDRRGAAVRVVDLWGASADGPAAFCCGRSSLAQSAQRVPWPACHCARDEHWHSATTQTLASAAKEISYMK